MAEWLHGGHAVAEALRGGARLVHEVWVRAGARVDEAVEAHAVAHGVAVRRVSGEQMATVIAGCATVAARCSAYRYRSETDLPAPPPSGGLVVVLDGIQDPQNLGAIVRTAEAAGAAAVCIPARRAAQITPAVVRAAAGATEHMAVHRVVNLVRTLQRLKDLGYWAVGLEPQAPTPWYAIDCSTPVALVVGSEDRGLRPLVARHCDHRVHLAMGGAVSSLNASAAFAAMAYEVVRQQRAK